MKKLIDLRLKEWYFEKQSHAFVAATVNSAYKFEVVKETEKAIQINIVNDSKLMNNWQMWIPKSVVKNLSEVLG